MTFQIPPSLFDLHEDVCDELINSEIGSTCKLVFPYKKEECDNCLFDPHTHRSSNIYKQGGPIPFENNHLCPRCNGVGLLETPNTDSIRLRIYWESQRWRDLGIPIATGGGDCMVIGYMADLPKLEQATHIIVHDDLRNIREYVCAREGEAHPWGFRKDRYFVQMLKRVGGE